MINNRGFAFVFLVLILALASVAVAVNAQGNATITVLASAGGTMTPSGTTTYPDGTDVSLSAAPQDNTWSFQYFIITDSTGASTTDFSNPTTLTVNGGVTYTIQPVFAPILPINATGGLVNYSTAAIVVILPSVGGSTSPAAGTYALANATTFQLKATANSGYQFSNWVISGSDISTGHGTYPVNLAPTDNPYIVNHGYGNTYYYQAVFKPVSTTSPGPSPTIPEMSAAALLSIVAAMGIVAVGTYAYKRKK